MIVTLYKGQSYRLCLNTGIDLSAATAQKILWKKPNGSERGEWLATVQDQQIFYDVTPADNTAEGIWIFQSYVETGGQKYYGAQVKQPILNNLK